ncbi:uncharacterized protein LOC120291396 [Eucalyptus grandis]|uniref:uncharacterized protein LOC120291396 n=1 Tax=Eucalyptus grandis TaxID=71139 RepID=UPI00192E8FAB|nr:uncharacterized protein LOC120291396 [Eucalyptus grandis]XP_039164615.1 uncharacterized protein LOC120291396 [Eucalyptus grandis]
MAQRLTPGSPFALDGTVACPQRHRSLIPARGHLLSLSTAPPLTSSSPLALDATAAHPRRHHSLTPARGHLRSPSTALATCLPDKAGRRLLLIVSSSAMTLTLLFVAVAFYIESSASDFRRLSIIQHNGNIVGCRACVANMGRTWIDMKNTVKPYQQYWWLLSLSLL